MMKKYHLIETIAEIMNSQEIRDELMHTHDNASELHDIFHEHATRLMQKYQVSYKQIRENRNKQSQGRVFHELRQKSELWHPAAIAQHLDISEKQVRNCIKRYIDAPAQNKNHWKPKRIPQFWEM